MYVKQSVHLKCIPPSFNLHLLFQTRLNLYHFSAVSFSERWWVCELFVFMVHELSESMRYMVLNSTSLIFHEIASVCLPAIQILTQMFNTNPTSSFLRQPSPWAFSPFSHGVTWVAFTPKSSKPTNKRWVGAVPLFPSGICHQMIVNSGTPHGSSR